MKDLIKKMYYIWVLFYEIIYVISEKLSVQMQISHWGMVLALFGYLCILYGWLKRTGRRRAVGLTKPSMERLGECMYGIPLFVLPLWNCLTVQKPVFDSSYLLLMLCVATIEEIFFRGFLYDILFERRINNPSLQMRGACMNGGGGYIFFSAILFGAFHLVNLLEGYPLWYVIMQTLCAFAAGLCYSLLMVKTQSIFPGIAAHVVTNLSGAIYENAFIENMSAYMDYSIDMQNFFNKSGYMMLAKENAFVFELWGLVSCIVIYIFYGIWLCKK